MSAEVVINFKPCSSDFSSLAIIHRLYEDDIAIMVINDQNVLVSTGRPVGIAAGEIRVQISMTAHTLLFYLWD